MLDLDTCTTPPALHYEIWQAGGELLERRELSMDEVNGRKAIEPSPYPLVPERMEPKNPSPKKKP